MLKLRAHYVVFKGIPEVVEAAKTDTISLSKAVELAKLPTGEQAGALRVLSETVEGSSNELTLSEQFKIDLKTLQVSFQALQAKRKEMGLYTKVHKLAEAIRHKK